jgi:hypothetical protein
MSSENMTTLKLDGLEDPQASHGGEEIDGVLDSTKTASR